MRKKKFGHCCALVSSFHTTDKMKNSDLIAAAKYTNSKFLKIITTFFYCISKHVNAFIKIEKYSQKCVSIKL